MKHLFLVAAATAALAACASVPTSDVATPTTSAKVSASQFEQDRTSILAMAGTYKVKFDFIETVALSDGYKVKDRKISGAYEVVKVIEDRGDFISLQHILYVGGEEKFPLKHWRQDWQYQPKKVLTFIGGNAWTTHDVTAADRKGAWSQEVYQVDDSPRYGGVGRWNYENGLAAWEPARAWRPLPRRDMTTRDDYHAVDAVNRHAITPDGWVHEQDNMKVVLSGDKPTALVREIAVNTYVHTDDVTSDLVDASWDTTKDYWAAIRESWEIFEDAREPFALTLKGEPQDLYMALLGYASEVENGGMTTEEAVTEAREEIGNYTTITLPALKDRLR
ncbi:MAG: hypothetical protein HRU11_11560 [Parvularculaceae bacterium]|nr:hypothetical protein [Parvularculaceae bacterium]